MEGQRLWQHAPFVLLRSPCHSPLAQSLTAAFGACLHSPPCWGCGAWLVWWHSTVRSVARRSDALPLPAAHLNFGSRYAGAAPRARMTTLSHRAALVSPRPDSTLTLTCLDDEGSAGGRHYQAPQGPSRHPPQRQLYEHPTAGVRNHKMAAAGLGRRAFHLPLPFPSHSSWRRRGFPATH